jgi:hypothetical protein
VGHRQAAVQPAAAERAVHGAGALSGAQRLAAPEHVPGAEQEGGFWAHVHSPASVIELFKCSAVCLQRILA